MDNLTGRALAECLLIHPEDANSKCAWKTLTLSDWMRLIKADPEFEQFRSPPPAGSPYTSLSIDDIFDLYREFMEDLKKFHQKS